MLGHKVISAAEEIYCIIGHSFSIGPASRVSFQPQVRRSAPPPAFFRVNSDEMDFSFDSVARQMQNRSLLYLIIATTSCHDMFQAPSAVI